MSDLMKHADMFPSLGRAEVLHTIRDLVNKSEGETVDWNLLGQQVCLRAWKKLHSIGDMAEYRKKHV
jgi:aryl carrier-like protein